jgi:hypothetical protein
MDDTSFSNPVQDSRKQNQQHDIHRAEADAYDFRLRIGRQKLAHDQSRHREHQTDLDADTYQQQEGRAGRYRPQGVAAEVLNQSIEDFVEPVDDVER